ncbi:unannotated protein [freshwater metagenome]|uniref:Unannotated protein n=1 Tax=freshwater metagenome TaxID=449393 RepID=A0A6J7SFW8_9ZZZZ
MKPSHPSPTARRPRATRPGSAIASDIAPGLGLLRLLAGKAHELGVDLLLVIVDKQVVEPRSGHDVLPQRNRSVLFDDDARLTTHLGEPLTKLLGVAHRGRERDNGHVLGQVDYHLLPHGAAEAIREVVHFVHHDIGQPRQGARPGVEHVA